MTHSSPSPAPSSGTPQFVAMVPTLPARDLCRTERWLEQMGFEIEGRFEEYLVAKRDGCELHYALLPAPSSTPNDDTECTAGIYVQVRDVNALHAELLLRGARLLSTPFDKPWGTREFAAEDPDGNLFRFATPIGDRGR